ncbi:MAG: hypothetical protein CMN30_22295 [Sandaracinus sp.]|nr:hypothetical protein [Sandaracinus sp.]
MNRSWPLAAESLRASLGFVSPIQTSERLDGENLTFLSEGTIAEALPMAIGQGQRTRGLGSQPPPCRSD